MHLGVKADTAELWLKLPSAPAIGVAVWFLADLGRRLHDVRERGIRTVGLRLPQVKAIGAAGFELVRSWHSAELPGLTVALFARL